MSRKEGYLIKEGYKVKNWKKRWFVLGQATLSYYTNHKSLKKVLGVVSLAEISDVSLTNQKKKGKLSSNRYASTRLFCGGRKQTKLG